MNSIQHDKVLLKIVDELYMLIKESLDFHQRSALLDLPKSEIIVIFTEALQILSNIHNRLIARNYIIAVVGLSNVGKSTLINALLGNEYAPKRNGPCTFVPVEFMYGTHYEVITDYKNISMQRKSLYEKAEEVYNYLLRLGESINDPFSVGLSKIVVHLPHPLLQNGLVISDTPGFGAANLNTNDEEDKRIRQYLEKEVSQVFWVVLAEQGISKREKQFHDQFFANVCNDIVVTGCEEWDDKDRSRFCKRYAQYFNRYMIQFHFVSGLQALEAKKTDDSHRLDQAGIQVLEDRIRKLAVSDQRIEMIQQTLSNLCSEVNRCLLRIWNQYAFFLPWWRPDSWQRFYSFLPDTQLAHQLKQELCHCGEK